MTARRKKHFEQAMLQGLLQRFTIPAHLVDGDFESPDAVILLEGRTIGVEVTEIQKSAEERAKRAPKDDILRRAKHAFDATNRKPVSATFSFVESEDLRWVNRVEIGEQISQFLLEQQHEENYDLVVSKGNQLPQTLRPYIREIRSWSESVRGIWQCSEATWVAPLTQDTLQECVDKKQQLLSLYKAKGYDAYWLLICAHPTNPACRFEPARDLDPTKIISDFDRTFFYDAWHAIELALPPGSTS